MSDELVNVSTKFPLLTDSPWTDFTYTCKHKKIALHDYAAVNQSGRAGEVVAAVPSIDMPFLVFTFPSCISLINSQFAILANKQYAAILRLSLKVILQMGLLCNFIKIKGCGHV